MTALDRDALYYPYIHFRDVNWLKATLLCFPQVRRIVPENFHLNDSPEVCALRELAGARGALVAEEPAYAATVWEAQKRLLERLRELPKTTLKAFKKTSVAKEHDGNTEKFQMHRGKLEPLIDFLSREGLAWPSETIRGGRFDGEWLALSPRLGEAVMSTVAVAIARDKGLDIVTNEGRVHRALSDLDEDAIFAELSGLGREPRAAGLHQQAELTDELVHTVLLTTFDVSKLSPQQIAELSTDGSDLRRFKNEVGKIAASLPDIRDPGEREKRMKLAAAEVVEAWQSHRKSLPRFALDALVSAASFDLPGIASKVLGLGSVVALGVGGGLAVFFGVHAGTRVIREYRQQRNGPYRFLTQVHKQGAIALAPEGRPTPRG